MKTLCVALLLLINASAGIPNKPVDKLDIHRFAGKWYSLYSIPTMFDKDCRETTAIYNLNSDGYYNVLTEAKKAGDNEIHTYNSKLFPSNNGGELKAQFLWPFKVDYWVIDIANDYSYMVVGNPDHKFLFIMSRKPTMEKKLHDDLVEKCKQMGYPVDKLIAQR